MNNPSVTVNSLESLPGYDKVQHGLLQTYIGIKTIDATPMTVGDYNKLREWQLPDNEDPNKEGYLVTYPDGHVSWSPKQTFEDAYRMSGNLSYAMALHLIQTQSHKGIVMYRSGWNGANMHVVEIDGDTLAQGIHRNYGDPSNPENNAEVSNALFLKNAQGKLFPWFPSQGDTNANDWCVSYKLTHA